MVHAFLYLGPRYVGVQIQFCGSNTFKLVLQAFLSSSFSLNIALGETTFLGLFLEAKHVTFSLKKMKIYRPPTKKYTAPS